MRVISFVPSITETLLVADVNVVGRTRFCIHPMSAKKIPVIGGTKDGQWEKIRVLKPDLVIFDREENTKQMAESCDFPFYAMHVTSVESLGRELAKLAEILANPKLHAFSQRAFTLLGSSFSAPALFEPLTAIPSGIETVLYVIWKDPWMVVSADTFIGDICRLLKMALPNFAEKYPKISLADYNPEKTLLLFSSEPFPFRKYLEEIKSLGFPAAMVDGENFSWFGIRSIQFLESSAHE